MNMKDICVMKPMVYRDINRFLKFMHIPKSIFLDSRFSSLDSRVSKLERLDLRDARMEFRGSSRDCQLTFERYCTWSRSDGNSFVFTRVLTFQRQS